MLLQIDMENKLVCKPPNGAVVGKVLITRQDPAVSFMIDLDESCLIEEETTNLE